VTSYFIGLVSGVLLSMIVILMSDNNQTKIFDCELELPRNQKCILVAIPDGDNNE
jgi:hypothetical protein